LDPKKHDLGLLGGWRLMRLGELWLKGKNKMLLTSIRPGSSFDLAVQKVDVSKPANRELRTALLRTNVKL